MSGSFGISASHGTIRCSTLVSGRLAITMTTVRFLKLTMARPRNIGKRGRQLWRENRRINDGCISEKREKQNEVDHPGIREG